MMGIFYRTKFFGKTKAEFGYCSKKGDYCSKVQDSPEFC